MARSRAALPLLILIAATWLVYWPVTQAYFVGWDDPALVFDNPGLTSPSLHNTLDFWRRPFMRMYTPLTYTAWSGVAAIAKEGQTFDALPFHLLNLALHTVAAIFVFLLLRELIGAVWPVWAGAMLFALHPLQVEPVAWVSAMNTVLAAALSAAALWMYVRYVRAAGGWRFAVATLLCAAALLSKPSAIVLPLLALVLDVSVLQRSLKVALKPLSVWLVMAAAMALVARLVQPGEAMQTPPPLAARCIVAVDAIGFYAVKLIAPFNLTCDYERSPHWLLQNPWAAWPGLLALTAAGACCFFRSATWTRGPLLLAGLALLPVLGLVPFDFQEYSTVADRYIYLSMLGVAWFVAGLMSRAGRRLPWALALIAIALCSARAFDQTRVWRDTPSLAARQLAYDPQSSTGHKILAAWYESMGHDDQAQSEFRLALADSQRQGITQDGAIWYEFGNLLRKHGRAAEAIDMYQFALTRMPREQLARACNNLGVVYYSYGNLPAARRQFVNALQAQPDFDAARKNLDRLDARLRRAIPDSRPVR